MWLDPSFANKISYKRVLVASCVFQRIPIIKSGMGLEQLLSINCYSFGIKFSTYIQLKKYFSPDFAKSFQKFFHYFSSKISNSTLYFSK